MMDANDAAAGNDLEKLLTAMNTVPDTVAAHKQLFIAILEYLQLLANEPRVSIRLQTRIEVTKELKESNAPPPPDTQKQDIMNVIRLYEELATTIEKEIDNQLSTTWGCMHPREEKFEEECSVRQKTFAEHIQRELNVALDQLDTEQEQIIKNCWTL